MATTPALAAAGLYKLNGLAQAYPQLAQQLTALVNQRIAALPWVPAGYAGTYNYLTYQNQGAIILPYPATNNVGQDNRDNQADFLDTPAKKGAWNQISYACQQAQTQYANNLLIEGAQTLQRLSDDAEFWGSIAQGIEATGEGAKALAVSTAQGITYVSQATGDAAIGLGKAVSGGVSDLFGGAASGLKNGLTIIVVLAAVGGLAYLYFTNAAFRKVLGGK